jgi:transcriptional regulator with XRE-family HTH domain
MPNAAQARFAENVRYLRLIAGISQERLAFRAEINRTEVSMMETGQRLPRLLTIVKLAGALEATPNDLCAGITWRPTIVSAGGYAISPPRRSDAAE